MSPFDKLTKWEEGKVPVLFIAFPLLGVILLNLLYKKAGRKAAFWTGLVVICVQMLMSLTLGGLIWQRLVDVLQAKLFADYSIDFFAATVLFTIGLIALISLIVGRYSDTGDKFNFVNLILIIMMGMNGVVMVNDIFSLYVFLEITAAASFVLIALYKGREALEGSFKYFVMSAVATIFLLSAISILFMSNGDLGYKAVGDYLKGLNGVYPAQLIIAFILFITGLSIKAGLVPFHMWVPDAYSSAPSPVSVLLGGIVTKVAGIYTLMRLFTDVFNGISAVSRALMFLGALSIVAGALAAIGQTDFKRMLAYSSISQVGYIILGVAIGTPIGFIGALLHFFNHATFKSLLFVNSTAVEMQTGTRDIKKLGGLASKMRITGGTSVVGFLSTAGIPPLSGFWSKLLIIIALWQSGLYAYAAIALLASILTLAYFLILQRNVFFGKIAEGLEDIKEVNAGIASPAILLSAVTVGMGLLFPLVLIYLNANGLL